jgi:hypothetical protein
VYASEACGKKMIILEQTLKQYNGDFRVLIADVILLFFSEPWLKATMKISNL